MSTIGIQTRFLKYNKRCTKRANNGRSVTLFIAIIIVSEPQQQVAVLCCVEQLLCRVKSTIAWLCSEKCNVNNFCTMFALLDIKYSLLHRRPKNEH